MPSGLPSFTRSARYRRKVSAVQTPRKVIERCILMTTDPGYLVFDPTCGSGTAAYCAEKWGRRWITCDTSRVAIALAKQRLMTAVYEYYQLSHPEEGVASGFHYKTMPHLTLKSIANNPDICKSMSVEEIKAAIIRHAQQETLYDQAAIDKNTLRVCGPFTVEAVPAPVVKSIGEQSETSVIDDSVARSGETTRQDQWRKEILATGVIGHGAEKISFSRVEPLQGTEWLHADAETKEREPHRVVISFGPEFAPLEQRQVAQAIEEAQTLVPRPKIVLFAAFQFDPEAAKDIDEIKWPGARCPLCHKQARGRDQMDRLFGYRNMDGFVRVQSWCRDCRGKRT